jgi:hypothetical protein
MALISHRFHSLILRVLQTRLLSASQLKDHKLMLECYHPSTKLSTPYLFCEYLGTSSLTSPSSQPDSNTTLELGELKDLYSHFRPLKPDTDHKIMRPHPAGGWPALPQTINSLIDQHDDFVCQNIHLESHELFSQLCTVTNLVKVGPKRGLFLSCVNISKGITRVWRDWLAKRSTAGRAMFFDNEETKKGMKERGERLIWADNTKTVGLRMRVVEREDMPAPVLVGIGEDAPVSYVLMYEGMQAPQQRLLQIRRDGVDLGREHG